MIPLKIGITGIHGFIGSHVARRLSDEGHAVISLDNYTRQSDFKTSDVESFPKGLNWVMHFGASTSINESYDKPFHIYSNNLMSTLTAAKIAFESKCAMIFMSSYVYGNPEYLPIDEKHPVSALNPYMGSKIAGEELCRQLNKLLSLPVVILRGFNIYGDWNSPGRLISDLISAAKRGDPLLVKDPAPRRDYLYIKDFNSLILKILTYKLSDVEIYNVGSGKSYSNYEVAEIVQSLANKDCRLIVQDRPRKNDVLDCYADVSLVKRSFSWNPSYSLEKGLGELINI
jgi:nucleoside-diphosphate-sugar epimerase